MTSTRNALLATFAISLAAVLYRNIDLRHEPTLDIQKVKLGLSSKTHDARVNAAAAVLLYAGMPKFKDTIAKSGIPEVLVATVMDTTPVNNSTRQFTSMCMHALARVCGVNKDLCKKLLRAHDLVGVGFKTANTVESYQAKAAAISLLAAIGPHSRQVAKRAAQPEFFNSMVELLQLGAAIQADDIVAAVSELMAFGLTKDELKDKVLGSGIVKTWMQVAAMYNDSASSGASLAALSTAVAYNSDTMQDLIQAGMAASLVEAIKQQSNMTTDPAMTLAIQMTTSELGRWALVNNNLLSLCAQMWYSGKVQYRWRLGCAEALLQIAQLGDLRHQIAVPKQPLAALITLARDMEHPAMQSSALDALRDVAHVRAAAVNMAERSVVASIVQLLHAITQIPDTAESADDEGAGWRLRSRRAICATLALLSIHQDLRAEVVAAQGVPVLVNTIQSTPGNGLAVQVRVTAAAALIAIGQDPQAREVITASGALPALKSMLAHPGSKQEQETAAAGIKLLKEGRMVQQQQQHQEL